MRQGRRNAILIVLGVAALVLASLVLIRNRTPDDEMLATIAVLGGLAMVIVALPGENGK